MSLRFLTGEMPTHSGVSRREWLRIGGLGGFGLMTAAGLNAARVAVAENRSARKSSGFAKAKSIILLYAAGGQSQLEMWDPKPGAPDGIRGQFHSIATSVPGVRFGEHMPRIAKLADRFTVVRSMSHDDLDHGSATYLALTGQPHPKKSSNPEPSSLDAPTIGSLVQRVRPAERFPHTAVQLNGPLLSPQLPSAGQFAGLLGKRFDPLVLGDVTASPVVVDGLEPLPDLPPVRQLARQTLLDAIDSARRKFDGHRSLSEMSDLYRQAQQLLDAPHCREAFDLSDEPSAVRDRYGRFRSGQACLLARRLVEAGVPLITVMLSHSNRGQDLHPSETDFYGWDTHNDIFEAMREHLLPRFDLSVSALLEDLEQRGLLNDTLVVCMGEFGRAPRVALEATFKGSTPGRKHWPWVYSIMLAGAGVASGHIVGASDRIAAYPENTPITPADVTASMFASLGIDPAGHYLDPTGRPLPLVDGQAVAELYG